MKTILGKILWNAISLNRRKDVTVYLCYHGNTDCLNVTVEENKTPVYQNRVFSNNVEGLHKIKDDLWAMRKSAKCE